ncbi:hypothetical protein ACLOJK_040474 [Asimina triloba]
MALDDVGVGEDGGRLLGSIVAVRSSARDGWWQGRANMDAGSCGVGSSGIAGRRMARWVSTHLDLALWKKGQPSVVMVGCGSGWKEAGGPAAVSPLTGWPALEKKMEY